MKVTDGTSSYRFDYDENGQVRTYTAANGTGSTFNYNQTGKLTDLVIGTSNQILLSGRYQYDKTGNRTKITHEGTGGTVTETNYVYDPINQLLKESLPNGTVKDYTYDGFGNRTSVKVTENGKETKSVTATFNEGNQLVKFGSESLTYDANDNRRIEKNVNGVVTRYFYDGDSINPLYETDGSGNVLRQYVYSIDGVRLAMKAQGQTLFYHYSPRGDVAAMTDQNGQVVANYEYDAWGNVLKSDTKGIAADNPFGYAGYMYDKEIGMYYLIARYYNPDHGVFLSVDPDPGDEDDPVTQNGYTYADNNPVMMTDPDGHVAWWVASGAVGGIANVGSYVVGHYAKHKTLKGMNYKRVGKDFLWGVAGGIIGGSGGHFARHLGKGARLFVSTHTAVPGYAVANAGSGVQRKGQSSYSGKGMARDVAYSMTGSKGYLGLTFATAYRDNCSTKKVSSKKKNTKSNKKVAKKR
ncbi:type IV secretion protein Rhs (plasmid) [Bacillus thuringiensis serovar coreanensis]|nr:type IV secretion protein Rhs [Bacillus thuringiensis serovar coreanensis]